MVSDIDAATAAEVAREITDKGGQAASTVTDVADREACQALVAATRERFGSIDVMVANAGIAQVKKLLEVTPEDLQRMLSINVGGVLWCLQAAAEAMIEQGHGGKIINAASIAGHQGFDHLGHYSASKFAVRGADPGRGQGAGAAPDHRQRLLPGHRRHHDVGRDRRGPRRLPRHRQGRGAAQYSQLIALGRVQTPEDVASFVSYLASRDADYMTGQAVMIDGGIVMV